MEAIAQLVSNLKCKVAKRKGKDILVEDYGINCGLPDFDYDKTLLEIKLLENYTLLNLCNYEKIANRDYSNC